MMQFRQQAAILIALLVAALGCGSKYDVVPVQGKLTYEGEGVPEMVVRFQPAVGRTSDAITNADGTFDMSYTMDTMGVEVDDHEISVIWASPTDDNSVKPSDLQKKVLADFKKNGPIKVKVEKPQKDFEVKLPR